MTKLQVAIDLLTTEAALELAHKVAPYVDIIELGIRGGECYTGIYRPAEKIA